MLSPSLIESMFCRDEFSVVDRVREDQGEANAFYPENEEHNESKFDSVSSERAAALAAYEEEMHHLGDYTFGTRPSS